jgi:hypothetical protein
MYFDISPLLSNNPYLGRLGYDRTFSLDVKSYYNPTDFNNRWSEMAKTSQVKENLSTSNSLKSILTQRGSMNSEVQEWDKKLTSTINLFAGDRTGEDRSSTAPY